MAQELGFRAQTVRAQVGVMSLLDSTTRLAGGSQHPLSYNTVRTCSTIRTYITKRSIIDQADCDWSAVDDECSGLLIAHLLLIIRIIRYCYFSHSNSKPYFFRLNISLKSNDYPFPLLLQSFAGRQS